MRSDTGPFRPDRLLGDLDHDLLPLAQQGVDLGRRWAVAALRAPARAALLFPVHPVELVDVVARVEECRLFQADVHERRLHAGKHAVDDALHDTPDHALIRVPLDVQVDEGALLEDGHPGLARLGVDYDLVLHPLPFAAPRIRARSPCSTRRARPGESIECRMSVPRALF